MLQSKLNLNTMLEVPTTPATERPATPGMPGPRIPMHTTDVCVIQLLLEQSSIKSTAVTVASVEAKFAPVSVTLAAAMVATL